MNKKWMSRYQVAEEYYNDFGSLNGIPSRSTLGKWLTEQKRLKSIDKLQEEKIALLEDIGIQWDTVREIEWKMYYRLVKNYHEKYGNINIPFNFKKYDIRLGQWIYRQRVAYSAKMSGDKELIRQKKITDEEIALLNELGMVWDSNEINKMNSIPEIIVRYYVKKYFKDTVKLLANDFLNTELDVYIPSKRIGIEYDGVAWHKEKNKDISKNKLCHDNNVDLIRIREYGLHEVEGSKNYFVKSDDMNDLQKVLKNVLKDLVGYEVDVNVEKDMSSILMDHQNYLDYTWMLTFLEIKEDYMVDGVVDIKQKDVSKSGFSLYSWISKQRKEYKAGILSLKRKEQLESIGVILDPYEHKFNEGFKHLKKFVVENGHAKVSATYRCDDDFCLGKWVSHRREDFKNGKLSQKHIDELNSLGFIWSFKNKKTGCTICKE